MGFLQDLKILYHLALRPVRGDSHAQRMENFYSGQAEAYDDFRKRLLQGREALYQEVPVSPETVWVDLGGGTGSNLEFISEKVPGLREAYVVDLSPSLLGIAQQRFQAKGWNHVQAVQADATTWQPANSRAQVVSFSYSLTMIPDWFAAIDNAIEMLAPGGFLAVVDFYVSRKYATQGLAQHGWFTRSFWPVWFSADNVFLSPDHLPYLKSRLETVWCQESRSKVPYIPFVRTPYYQFIGRKPAE
jgi:S-adenosylmethionine-diacylgycerolhomoserine-N-methlytransferase